MIPETITIDGKQGTVVYLDKDFQPVPKEHATMAKVVFDDGTRTFYEVTPNAT